MLRRKRICLYLGIILVLFSILSPVPASAEDPASRIKDGDIVCFGTPDAASGFDGKWLVLDAEHTSTGEDGMFLLALNLIGSEEGLPLLFRDIGDVSVSFSDRGEAYAAAHPGVLDYQSSDIRKWCSAFPERYLDEAERLALLPTYKSDAGIAIPGFRIPLPGVATGTVDFDPAENILNGDTVFLLSTEEATSAAYGMAENRSRVALFKDSAEGYWLRSPHIPTFPLDVGFVFSFGAVMDYPVNANSMYSMATYARPACNLDSSRIADAEALLTTDGTTIWRVSFLDGEPNTRTYDLSLPDVGTVPDVQSIIRYGLIIVLLVPLLVIALIVWLIIRRIRKKKRTAPQPS